MSDAQKIGKRIELTFVSESTLEVPIYRYQARYLDEQDHAYPFPDEVSMLVPDALTKNPPRTPIP